MTTSGSRNYSVTRDDIIKEALEQCGAIEINQTPSTNLLTSCSRTLNMLVKAWQAEGLFLWTYRDATLYLEYQEDCYSLGSGGDHASETVVETTLSAAAAAAATTITLTSTTGMTNGDYIGVELDDGTLHWTTIVNKATTSITAGLASAAASGNAVYTYTSKISRPIQIVDAYLRDANSNDRPLTIISLSEYRALTDKTSDGSPVFLAYDPQLSNGLLYTWPRADDVDERIRFTYKSPIEDFDAAADDAAFPQDWYWALTLNLADALSAKLGLSSADRRSIYEKAMQAKAALLDSELVSVFIQPDFR